MDMPKPMHISITQSKIIAKRAYSLFEFSVSSPNNPQPYPIAIQINANLFILGKG